MDLRPVMEVNIAWKIGSGETINIYSQPWFPGWQELKATTSQQRAQRVAFLLDPITRLWNFEALQQLFGLSRALLFATMDSIKPSPQPASDTLIFTFAKNGVFSVRKAYQLLKNASAVTSDRKFWGWVWKRVKADSKIEDVCLAMCTWCSTSNVSAILQNEASITHVSNLQKGPRNDNACTVPL